MVDGAQDRAIDAYLDEWDRPLPEPTTDKEWLTQLEAGYAAWRRLAGKASSEQGWWYYIGCAIEEQERIEALRRKLQEGNDGNG